MRDGTASIGVPGPDDRPRDVDATWRRDGDAIVVSPRGGGDALRVSRESAKRIVVRK
jgi:hypothetical protein